MLELVVSVEIRTRVRVRVRAAWGTKRLGTKRLRYEMPGSQRREAGITVETARLHEENVDQHRRSQDFLWGCTFLAREKLTTYLVIAIKTPAKSTKLTTPTFQISPFKKMDFSSAWGALITFPYKMWPPIFSPAHPLATPMSTQDHLEILARV